MDKCCLDTVTKFCRCGLKWTGVGPWTEVCTEFSLAVCDIIILGSERTARYVFRVSMANRCQGGNGEVCVGRMNIRARRTRDFEFVVGLIW
jgi:hypothetical protein